MNQEADFKNDTTVIAAVAQEKPLNSSSEVHVEEIEPTITVDYDVIACPLSTIQPAEKTLAGPAFSARPQLLNH